MRRTTIRGLYLCALITFSLSYFGFSHGVALVQSNGQLMNLSETHVDVQINNQIAIVTSRQVFINKTGEDIQVKYGFPLNEGANPIRLRWRVGKDDWKEAVVEENDQDESLPNTSGGNGTVSSSALDAYLGAHPLFFETDDLIGKGLKFSIEITYVELLPYSFGEVQFEYPWDYSLIQFDAIDLQSFNLNLESEREIIGFSENLVNADNQNTGNVLSITSESQFEKPGEDIAISYTLSSEGLGIMKLGTMVEDSLYGCDFVKDKGFVSLIIEPESNDQVEVLNKNFTLIIDKSGSMSGDKIVQARGAASFIVENLNEGDRFNIITFSSGVESLYGRHRLIDDNTKAEALSFIASTPANGTTNISGAMTESIQQFDVAQDDNVNIVIFFTDGIATSGIRDTDDILELIQDEVQTAETEIFLFTFGIGDDVDKRLLTLMAVENSGLVDFLEDQDLLQEITNFFLKINNPLLIDLEMSFDPPNVITEVYPSLQNLPNLYKGEQLIVSGRYEQADSVTMTLTGKAYNLDLVYEFPIDLTGEIDPEKSFLPKIWAKQKIDDLGIQFYAESNPSIQNEIEGDIDALSKCYGVVNLAFNSFVDGALEIDLLEFTARNVNDKSVTLEWVTAIEYNNEKFVIQRSVDGETWINIGEVEGAINSDSKRYYTFEDLNPVNGLAYYRLKNIEISGEAFYSMIRSVELNKDFKDIEIFPTLLEQGQSITVQYDNIDSKSFLVINQFGELVNKGIIKDGFGVVETNDLPTGTYILHYQIDQKPRTKKFIIQ